MVFGLVDAPRCFLRSIGLLLRGRVQLESVMNRTPGVPKKSRYGVCRASVLPILILVLGRDLLLWVLGPIGLDVLVVVPQQQFQLRL